MYVYVTKDSHVLLTEYFPNPGRDPKPLVGSGDKQRVDIIINLRK